LETDTKKPKTFKARKPFVSYTQFALSKTEYKRLLQACGTLEEEVMLQIAVNLGLRRVDISKILIANIDLDNRTLTYHEHKKNRDRTLPFTQDMAQLLRKYLHTLTKDTKYLFSWGKSKYGDYTAYRRLQTLCDNAGIPRRPFHALRGTCYKFCKDRGWSVEQAAYMLGDSVNMAITHYGIPSPGEIKDLVDAMGDDDK